MCLNKEVVCLLLCCRIDLLLYWCPNEQEGETIPKESKRDGKCGCLSLAVVIRNYAMVGLSLFVVCLQLWSSLRSVCVVGVRCSSSCWLWLQRGTEET